MKESKAKSYLYGLVTGGVLMLLAISFLHLLSFHERDVIGYINTESCCEIGHGCESFRSFEKRDRSLNLTDISKGCKRWSYPVYN